MGARLSSLVFRESDKTAWRDPMDLSRPVDVPCKKCGSYNYIEERISRVRCFNCKEEVSRADFGAEGLESSGEYAEARKDEINREAHSSNLGTIALGLAAAST